MSGQIASRLTSDPQAKGASGSTANIDVERLDILLSRLELMDVQTFRLTGELKGTRLGDDLGLVLDVKWAFRRPDTGLDCRFNVIASITEDDGETQIAEVRVGLVLKFSVDGEDEISSDDARMFMRSVGTSLAVPYIRESIHSMTLRLGIPAIVLGIVRPGEFVPRTAMLRVSSSHGPEPSRLPSVRT